MKKLSTYLFLIAAAAVGFVLTLYFPPPVPLKLNTVLWFEDQSRPLPAFELSSENKVTLSNGNLQGHWSLLFFGYTHCPDVCPQTLQHLGQLIEQLPPQLAQKIRIIFISVDPERDSLETLNRYTRYFDESIIAATGTHQQLQQLTRFLGISYQLERNSAGMITNVVHSGRLVLIDPNGHYSGLINPPFEIENIIQDLQALEERT